MSTTGNARIIWACPDGVMEDNSSVFPRASSTEASIISVVLPIAARSQPSLVVDEAAAVARHHTQHAGIEAAALKAVDSAAATTENNLLGFAPVPTAADSGRKQD